MPDSRKGLLGCACGWPPKGADADTLIRGRFDNPNSWRQRAASSPNMSGHLKSDHRMDRFLARWRALRCDSRGAVCRRLQSALFTASHRATLRCGAYFAGWRGRISRWLSSIVDCSTGTHGVRVSGGRHALCRYGWLHRNGWSGEFRRSHYY